MSAPPYSHLTLARAAQAMFSGAVQFNGDISSWSVRTVLYTHDTFKDATSFNADIGAWDTSAIEDMEVSPQPNPAPPRPHRTLREDPLWGERRRERECRSFTRR